MAAGGIDWVVVGSDRIAANGDVANKIGTYHLALAARYHGIKVMVAAPTSTVDMSMASGDVIPIEKRDSNELLSCGGYRIAAVGVPAWNPVFDITPACLVDAIVTEKGIILQPNAEKMQKHMS
jgi:methylthioribose-1-phosphate isomerase